MSIYPTRQAKNVHFFPIIIQHLVNFPSNIEDRHFGIVFPFLLKLAYCQYLREALKNTCVIVKNVCVVFNCLSLL